MAAKIYQRPSTNAFYIRFTCDQTQICKAVGPNRVRAALILAKIRADLEDGSSSVEELDEFLGQTIGSKTPARLSLRARKERSLILDRRSWQCS
jgi:hypothetical protein